MGVLPKLNYPSIERQDLTQGQLGSFKFTPVDSPSQQYSHQGSGLDDTPFLWQAQAKLRDRMEQQPALDGVAYLRKPGRSQSPKKYSNRQNDSSLNSAFSHPSQPQSPNSLCDPTFFNKHIKPDLEDSRLRLGTAAFRFAVNGTSPERDLHYHKRQCQLSPLFPPCQESQFHDYLMNMDLNPASTGLDEAALMDLFLAFKTEQKAHQETQESLKATVLRMAELEQQNKSLLASTKMLQGIIKHNASRLERCDEIESRQNVKTNGGSGSASNKSEKSTQAHATVLQQTTTQHRFTDGPAVTAEDHDTTLVKQVDPVSDHSKLFNLDMLKNRASDDFNSARGRTLRKHFSVDDTSSSSSVIAEKNPTNPQAESLVELVHISPQKIANMSLPKDREETSPVKTAPKEMQGTETYPRPNLHTADDGLLELPASFLNKYSGAKKNRNIEEEKVETFFESPAVGCDASDTSDEQIQQTLATEVKSCDFNDPSIAPLDLSIKWKVTKENPIYDDDYEKGRAASSQFKGAHKEVFWRHPVRFLEHGGNDKNIFRTVMIDYIPTDATYQDVLDQVRGGSLEKIELVPSIGRVTSFQTARLVFNFELGASTTANYARDHGMVIKGKKVRVWQVITQTYPKNNELDYDVFEQAYTRILIMENVSKAALELIPDKLAHLHSSIVGYGETFDQYPMIEFTSVAAATAAMRVFISDKNFAGAKFDFEEDYCGEPYPFAY